MSASDATAPTRERLMDAGMQLFADSGFKATTVGEIEAAVGLRPRRGALYKHFPSKRALLDAAVARHLEAVATAAAQVGDVDAATFARSEPDDLRAFIRVVGRWFLDELDAQRRLTRMLEHDGDQLESVAKLVHDRIVDVGYAAAAQLVRGVAPNVDADAFAVVLLGALAGARRTAWTFGAMPLEVDDERLLTAWADTCLALRDALRPG